MMTANDIHILIEQDIQILGGVANENLQPEYLDMQFNLAMNRYVKHRYTQSYDPKAFSYNLKRLVDLKDLVSYMTIDKAEGNTGIEMGLPVWGSNKLYNGDLKLPLAVNIEKLDQKICPGRIIAGDNVFEYYDDYTKHAFKRKVYSNHPFVYMDAQNLYVLLNGFQVSKVFVNYIEFPQPINILDNTGTNLPDNVVEEIVAMTVTKIRSLIDPERYQLQQNEELKLE